ncbi:MAG: tRNA dihydrouridine synthase DusB [Akkermansia sp.]
MNLPWFDKGAFPLFLAPMAGVTDPIFRTICKGLGADVMVTEFVSAEGVLQCWERNKRYTEFSDEHRPLGIQLFGANANHLGEAAKIIVNEQHPDFIDINFGCPVPKVVGKNGGSSLLKDLPTLATVVRGAVKAVGHLVPITAKIRIGWDAHSICALEVCHILEQEGASMITIHGRTRTQQYSGLANWDIIRECARSTNLPVIGNGDIHSVHDIQKIKGKGDVRGVMIGRAAMENPWIFQEAAHFLKTGEILPPQSRIAKWDLILHHTQLSIESKRYGDELNTMKFMRARLLAYSKGFPGAKDLRSRLVKVSSLAELNKLRDFVLSL